MPPSRAGISMLPRCVAKAKGCKMASFVSFSYADGNTVSMALVG